MNDKHEIVSYNAADLDIEELEQRLELTGIGFDATVNGKGCLVYWETA